MSRPAAAGDRRSLRWRARRHPPRHDRVVEFPSAGRMLAAFGSAGSGRGQLNHPVALAVTPFGDVWVADQGNGRVVEFSAAGRYRVSFAVPAPSGVALDARGDV